MSLPPRDVVKEWIGRRVVSSDGEDLGTCRMAYADDDTGVGEWLSVALEDGTTAVVPITGADELGDTVRVAFAFEAVVSAPRTASWEHIDGEEEKALYGHYGVPYSTAVSDTGLPAGEPADAGTSVTSTSTSTAPSGRIDTPSTLSGSAAGGTSGTGLGTAAMSGTPSEAATTASDATAATTSTDRGAPSDLAADEPFEERTETLQTSSTPASSTSSTSSISTGSDLGTPPPAATETPTTSTGTYDAGQDSGSRSWVPVVVGINSAVGLAVAARALRRRQASRAERRDAVRAAKAAL
ncbi:MAG: hypothetical protein M3Q27_11700, partial [Actinomycetota bacterium]|nr:hypothetical protein [Actinomycetota bacterium]